MATPGAWSLVPVLAHQGGWDEALMVGIPVLLLFALLRVAKRRAGQQRLDADAEPSGPADDAGATPEPPTP